MSNTPELPPDIAIRISNVSKAYKIYDSNRDLLLEVLTGKSRHRDHWALKDVTADISRGTVVGIIGPNGSGKSTMLKIITGLLDPTIGSVAVNGKVSAILELGTGFHPDFTGRDNIITGGMCIGMTREEIERKLPWIVDFSELGDVIDQPFRTYSSGMQARLTFSTAIAVDPEILIIDEALAAGDAFFVNKCMKRIREICSSGATVLFVSHGSGQVATLCDQAIWIDKGKVREIGPAREVTRHYDYHIHERISEGVGKVVDLELDSVDTGVTPDAMGEVTPAHLVVAKQKVYRRGPVHITNVWFLDAQGRKRRSFATWEDLTISVEYACPAAEIPYETLGLAIGIERESDLLLVAQFNTCNYAGNETDHYLEAPFRQPAKQRGVLQARLAKQQLLHGDYLVSVGLVPNIPGTVDFYEYHHRTYRLHIAKTGVHTGAVFYPQVEWRHQETE